MPLILGANSVTGGYEIDNSLRFNSGSSDYLNRTYGTPTNNKIWTLSFWVKRTELGREQHILNGGGQQFYFSSGDVLAFGDTGGTQLVTSQVFRDVSAWYHIIYATDTTQATASDRVKMYVNGTQVTSFSTGTYPTINSSSSWNTASTAYYIARYNPAPSGLYWSTYLSETYFIDGQQLTPTDFGEFDADSGIWKPIAYSGTYGTNGFFLEFQDSGALGTDSSGNANTFTVNNLTSIDQTTDTPTNNFATFNPLSKNDAGTVTFSEGNLFTAHSGTDSVYTSYSTQGISQGKWYVEFKYEVLGSNNDIMVGVGYDIEGINRTGSYLGSSVATWGYDSSNGNVYNNGSGSAYGDTFAQGDIISVALDLDNNKLYLAKNGTWQNSGVPTSGATGTGAVSITSSQTYFLGTCHATTTTRTSSYSANFGNPPFTISSGNSDANGYGNFEYAVPTGYLSLCTKNLSEVNS
jgi:hypothetical protein